MQIAHIAIWTKDLETMKEFYKNYFGGESSGKYTNPVTKYKSYFIGFKGGTKLELMSKPSVADPVEPGERLGLSHISFKLNSTDAVISLTEKIRSDGYTIVSEPRITGDGYFESVVLDAEGNRVELMA